MLIKPNPSLGFADSTSKPDLFRQILGDVFRRKIDHRAVLTSIRLAFSSQCCRQSHFPESSGVKYPRKVLDFPRHISEFFLTVTQLFGWHIRLSGNEQGDLGEAQIEQSQLLSKSVVQLARQISLFMLWREQHA